MRRYRSGRDTGLPPIRFKYECIEACHLGTDDPEEFAEHLTECDAIFPQVREYIALKKAQGWPIVGPSGRRHDADGQTDLFSRTK